MAKFCTNCGNKIGEGQKHCVNCGIALEKTTKSSKKKETETTTQKTNSNYTKPAKSKIVAGLLGIFLGCYGVHNFYLGYNSKATAQLLLTVLSCCTLSWVTYIWGFVEGIMILTGSIHTDADGNELVD